MIPLDARDFLSKLTALPRTEHTEHLLKELQTWHYGDAGVLVITERLDLDTDGFNPVGVKMDPTHQSQTSLHWPNGKPVDSNLTPFVVIPGHWGKRHGLVVGDVGLAQFGTFAPVAVIIADTGPADKIGEGSIALHRAFSHETVIGNHVKDAGLDGTFRMLLFPGSSKGYCLLNTEIERIALAHYNALIA